MYACRRLALQVRANVVCLHCPTLNKVFLLLLLLLLLLLYLPNKGTLFITWREYN